MSIRRLGWFACWLLLPVFAYAVAGQENVRLNLAQELGFPGLSAPGASGGKHIEFSASFTVQKGSRRGMLSFTAQIEPGWHVYSTTQQPGGPMPSKISAAESDQYKLLGPFQANQPPQIKRDPVYKVPIEEHQGRVTWTAPIELVEGVNPQSLAIVLRYDGQVCSEVCIPLINEKVTATFAGYTEAPLSTGEYRPQANQAQLVLQGHIEPAGIKPGGKARLVITALPDPGWHIYAYAPQDPDVIGANKPTLIVLNPLPGWQRSPVKASAEPKVKPPLGAGLPEERYHDQPITWTIELTAPTDSPPGEVVVSGSMGFQTCKESGCLPPQAVQFRASLSVEAEARPGTIPLEFIAASSPGGIPSGPATYDDVARLAAANPQPTGKLDLASLVPMIGFGLLGGLILNLMPCVLPVIGLKIMSFMQQAGESRARIFALNAWFALGLLLVFLVLATAAVFANLSWGEQFTYGWFKITMIVVVFAFALSFLGVWELPIPGFAESNTSGKLQQKEGPAGAFFKGIFTTLLATPCSGPFLGPVFAYTLLQPPLATYIIFFSVGLGMASPYLLIGAFPALVRWLPKPGEWMETVKQLMGFVLLGTVVYLFTTIKTDDFIPTLTLMMGVWFACWIIGRVPVYEPAPKQLWAWVRGAAAAGAIGWAAFTFLGPEKHLYQWQPFSPQTLAQLQSEGKTVMVDFTADWCLTCQWNFKTAINTRRVKEIVEKNGVVPVLADWSDHNETIKQKLAELNSNSIPLLAIYPAGRPDEVILLPDALLESQVVAALERAGPSKSPAKTANSTAEAVSMQPSGG